jgi:hypothetical protein
MEQQRNLGRKNAPDCGATRLHPGYPRNIFVNWIYAVYFRDTTLRIQTSLRSDRQYAVSCDYVVGQSDASGGHGTSLAETPSDVRSSEIYRVVSETQLFQVVSVAAHDYRRP